MIRCYEQVVRFYGHREVQFAFTDIVWFTFSDIIRSAYSNSYRSARTNIVRSARTDITWFAYTNNFGSLEQTVGSLIQT